MREQKEQPDPQQELDRLIREYQKLSDEHKFLAANEYLKRAKEWAKDKSLNTSAYDIPGLQEKQSPFSNKEEEVEFYRSMAESQAKKGNEQIARAYRKAAEELEKQKNEE